MTHNIVIFAAHTADYLLRPLTEGPEPVRLIDLTLRAAWHAAGAGRAVILVTTEENHEEVSAHAVAMHRQFKESVSCPVPFSVAPSRCVRSGGSMWGKMTETFASRWRENRRCVVLYPQVPFRKVATLRDFLRVADETSPQGLMTAEKCLARLSALVVETSDNPDGKIEYFLPATHFDRQVWELVAYAWAGELPIDGAPPMALDIYKLSGAVLEVNTDDDFQLAKDCIALGQEPII